MNPSALLECLHLEALGVHVSLQDSLVTLGGCRKDQSWAWSSEDHRAEVVFVSGSDHGDCEVFFTFPRRRVKR